VHRANALKNPDTTYLAENGLVTGLDLPLIPAARHGRPSLMTSEAVLQTRLHQHQKGKGVYLKARPLRGGR